jgi:hypothetical protein
MNRNNKMNMNKMTNTNKINLNPLFDNIKEWDYKKPIKELAKYYKESCSKHFTLLEKKLKDYKIGKNETIHNFDGVLDEIMYYYIQSRPNISVITVFPSYNKRKINEIIEFLQKYGNVYGVKNINLSQNAARNLIYQLYFDQHNLKKNDIIHKANLTGWFEDSDREINVIIFENKSKENISGKDAFLKHRLRCFISKVDFKPTGELIPYEEKMVKNSAHINDTFFEAIMYGGIYFNQNSLDFLKEQILPRYLSVYFDESRVRIIKFRNWLYQNIQLIDLIRFLFFSGIVLFSYGIRRTQDVDGIIEAEPKTGTKTKNFGKIIDKNFYDEKSKIFDYVDISMKDSQYWLEEFDEYNKKWAEKCKVDDFSDFILNSVNNYQFLGLKIIKMDYEIIKRQIYPTTGTIIDLIMINELYEKKIPVSIDILYDGMGDMITDNMINILSKKFYFRYGKKYGREEIMNLLEKYIPKKRSKITIYKKENKLNKWNKKN